MRPTIDALESPSIDLVTVDSMSHINDPASFRGDQTRLAKSTGLLIADFDIVIAATAIEHDLMLITRNRKHFERISGLRFVSPEALLSG